MKRTVLLCVAALAVVPTMGAAPGTINAQIQAVLDAQCTALKAANYDAYGATMTPDFVYSSDGQSFSREQIIAQAKMMSAQLKFTSCADTIDSAKKNVDNSVTAVVDEKNDGTVPTPQGIEPLEAVSKETLTFVPGTVGLLLSREDVISSSISVAGQVVHSSGGASPAPSPSAGASATPAPVRSSTPTP